MNEGNVQAGDFLSRSPIYRALLAQGARFRALGNTAIAASYGGKKATAARREQLGLADLSPLSRVGFKGRGVLDWLRKQRLQVPDRNGTVATQSDGSLLARLTDGEMLVLEALDGRAGACEALSEEHAREMPQECYFVPRHASHAWFLVSGKRASEMFAKLCALDLRSRNFPIASVAQTVIAGVSGFIIRAGIGSCPAFHLLVDVSLAEYVWSCLLDAKAEFNGALVGYDDLIGMCAEGHREEE